MQEVTHSIPSTLATEEPWQAIAQLARCLAGLADSESRATYLRDFCRKLWGVAEVQYFPIARNLADIRDRPGKGVAAFLEYVGKLGHPIVVSGLEVGELGADQALPPLLTDPRWKSFVLAPVTAPGRVVGVLVLAEETDREFGEQEVAQLTAIVPQVAAVLDHATLAEENRYKDRYSRALGDIDMMISSYDVVEILRHGVRTIYETVDAEKVLVFLVNQDTGALRVSVAEGCPYSREGNLQNEPCAKLAMQALNERRSQVVGASELEGLAGVTRREACTEKQAIITPIMANSQVYGVLEVFDKKNGKPFHRNEVAFINQVALKLALVIQNIYGYLTINTLKEGLESKVKERTAQLENAITTLQDTQSQLMQTEKLATIGTLAGGVAHEINNPLAAILANVQLLRLDVTDQDQIDSLGIIESGAKRCKHIVENLLNFSRQSAPEHRSLSLNQVLEDTIDLLQHQLKHTNIRINRRLADQLPPVLGTSTEMGQIFTNLIVNALDAIAERHTAPAVGHLTIRSYLDGKQVIMEFEDDGCGIEEYVLRKIFDPFFTTKQVGKGTGLGLSVSQQIATSFGGHIEASSFPGQGSTFRVVLPRAHGQDGPLPKFSSPAL